MATTTAIDLVRRMEDEPKNDFKNLFSRGLDAQQMIEITCIRRCHPKGKYRDYRQKPEDMINTDCYDDVDWFTLPANSVLTFIYL